MQCPECKKADTRVIDSRDDEKNIRRRRECLMCGFRFTTYERIENPKVSVRKRDGRIENFDGGKIKSGVMKALEKRPLAENEIDELLADIEQELFSAGEKIIPSFAIGECVAKKLRQFDDVAYLRFISVYKSFSSAKSFENEAKKLVQRKSKKVLRRKRG